MLGVGIFSLQEQGNIKPQKSKQLSEERCICTQNI